MTQLSPSSGYVGTTVTVTGAGFGTTLAGNAVKFNGAPAVVTSATRTSLIATVPAGPSPPCSGTPMPKGAPLSAAEKQRLVDWVAQGAP